MKETGALPCSSYLTRCHCAGGHLYPGHFGYLMSHLGQVKEEQRDFTHSTDDNASITHMKVTEELLILIPSNWISLDRTRLEDYNNWLIFRQAS